jgi:hypothetical protein
VPPETIESLKGSLILIHDSQLSGSLMLQLDCAPQVLWLAVVPSEITEGRSRLLLEFGAADLIPEVLDDRFRLGLLRGKIGHLLSSYPHRHQKNERLLNTIVEQQLTRKEEQLFEFLFRSGKEGLEKTELVSMLWPRQKVSEKSLDVHLFNLRRKLVGTDFAVLCRNRRIFLEVKESVSRPKSS